MTGRGRARGRGKKNENQAEPAIPGAAQSDDNASRGAVGGVPPPPGMVVRLPSQPLSEGAAALPAPVSSVGLPPGFRPSVQQGLPNPLFPPGPRPVAWGAVQQAPTVLPNVSQGAVPLRPPTSQQALRGPRPPSNQLVESRGAAGDDKSQGTSETDLRHVQQGLENIQVRDRAGAGDRAGAAAGAAAGTRRRARGALMYIAPTLRPDGVQNVVGAEGTQIQLCTNAFELNVQQQFHIYQYSVDFVPDVLSPSMRQSMIRQHEPTLGRMYLFDRTSLFRAGRLDRDETELSSLRPSDNQIVKIVIKLRCEVLVTSPDYYRLRNILWRRVLQAIGMKLVGQSFVNPGQRTPLPQHRMEVWPGYDSSILQFDAGPLLLIDVAHKFINQNTVYDVMNEINRQSRGQDFLERCKKEITGCIVLTRYNNKTYRIDDIDFDKNPQYVFDKDGTPTAIIDYLTQAYGPQIVVRDMRQPLLLSRPKAKDRRGGRTGDILLVPELCFMTGLPQKMRQDFRVMRDLSTYMHMDPNVRCQKLMNLRQQIAEIPDAVQVTRDWQMQFSERLLSVRGRCLPIQQIIQGGPQSKPYDASPKADWAYNMRSRPLLVPMPLNNWIFIYPGSCTDVAARLSHCLSQICPPMGVQFARPSEIPLDNDGVGAYIRALRSSINNQKIVLCLLPDNRKDRYDALKKLLCIDLPVPSQMILKGTLTSKGNQANDSKMRSVATKLVQQMVSKMGGELWAVQIPLKGTMIIGIDTYHDSSRRGRSVAGFVASINDTFTRYFSNWSFQEPGEELQNSLSTLTGAAIRKFHEVNGAPPRNIIVYRDGVGDGQLEYVQEHEIGQIRRCMTALQLATPPRLTFIVVKKRINHRFFVPGKTYSNPPPGTVVDSTVTRPGWFDFFIVSQSVNQGTVSPTHYNVIHHEIEPLTADRLQLMTYRLCHLYYNWPGTIRVPAPCQYAHKIAYLIGESLHRDPHMSLADKLFYL